MHDTTRARVMFLSRTNCTEFVVLTPIELLTEVESLAPDFPLLALSSKLAHSLILGAQPLLFSLITNDNNRTTAVGSLQYGRLRKELLLTILEEIPLESAFWHGLQRFIAKHDITTCRITSVFRSPLDLTLPSLGREIENYQHVKLYVADLEQGDINIHYSSNHKRNISKAIKAGIQITEANEAVALQSHFELTSASVARRSMRGESIALRTTRDHVIALSQSGRAQLYQATLDGCTLSSKLVYFYGHFAFYYDGGTSAQGMKLGASHLLMSEIMSRLQKSGIKRFNMGLAAEASGDLWRFKQGFGTELWIANNLGFDCTNRLKLIKNGLGSILWGGRKHRWN